jgi:small subunit ribosomal protein S6
MRQYEIMFILPAEADDKVIGGVTDRIGQVVARSGGEVGKTDRWGRRRFSYEIDRATEGYYLVVEFTADPADVRELERVLTLADEVVRFKVMLLPEKKANAWVWSPQAQRGEGSTREVAPPAATEEPAAPEPEEPAETEPEVVAEETAPAAGGAA